MDPEACDHSQAQFAASAAREAEGEIFSSTRAEVEERRAAPGPPTTEDMWREEVASRVHSYRARRRNRARDNMRLDFEAASQTNLAPDYAALRKAAIIEKVAQQMARAAQPPSAGKDSCQLPVASGQQDCAAQPPSAGKDSCQLPVAGGQQAGVAQPPSAVAASPKITLAPDEAPPRRRERRIIEFPKLFEYTPPTYDLADPVLEKPRILDVPEEVANSGPASLADIALDAEPQPPEPQDFELPLQVAPLSLRLCATLLDAFLVLLAVATFAMIAASMGVAAPQSRATFALSIAVPGLLWAVYQYLFLVHAGATPGMKVTNLGVCTFDDELAPRHLRRWRALGMVLSAISLGLGFLWALVDEDTLCWHDRISRTYSRVKA